MESNHQLLREGFTKRLIAWKDLSACNTLRFFAKRCYHLHYRDLRRTSRLDFQFENLLEYVPLCALSELGIGTEKLTENELRDCYEESVCSPWWHYHIISRGGGSYRSFHPALHRHRGTHSFPTVLSLTFSASSGLCSHSPPTYLSSPLPSSVRPQRCDVFESVANLTAKPQQRFRRFIQRMSCVFESVSLYLPLKNNDIGGSYGGRGFF